jgi:AraC-like DNA-binding protein
MDPLDSLLRHVQPRAALFFSGALCGIADIDEQPGRGQLHLIREGGVEIRHGESVIHVIDEPAVLFYPTPQAHRLITDARIGSPLACAHIAYDGGDSGLMAMLLPAPLLLPLRDAEGLGPTLSLLFAEAFGNEPGRRVVVDRLFEVVVALLIRHLLVSRAQPMGLVAGLADPSLSRVLSVLHADLAKPWTLSMMADIAHMSRSAFAARFHQVVGDSPASYLATLRLGRARQLLGEGRALAQVADRVGYGSEGALSRAFKQQYGQSIRSWRAGRT